MQEEEEQPQRTRREKHEYFQTRMSSKQVHDLVPRLIPGQRQTVKDIGFGSLLDIKLNLCEGMLVNYLLHHFDIYGCVMKLDNEELHLEEDNVESTLGLLRGTKTMVEWARSDSDGGP